MDHVIWLATQELQDLADRKKQQKEKEKQKIERAQRIRTRLRNLYMNQPSCTFHQGLKQVHKRVFKNGEVLSAPCREAAEVLGNGVVCHIGHFG